MKREHTQAAPEPYRPSPTSPAALIETATETCGRIARVAPYATAQGRVRLMGELALVGYVLESVEREVKSIAQLSLKAVEQRRALPAREHDESLPQAKRRALPPAPPRKAKEAR